MKIGVVQLTSVLDYKINLDKISKFLDEAKGKGVQTVFLPENFYSLSDGLKATPYLVDPENKNEHYKNILNLAKEHKVNLVGGSAATKLGNKITNRAYNVSSSGELLNYYDKIHLFACDLSNFPEKKVLNESIIYTPGNDPQVLEIDFLKIGVSICFDLRFPEMFRDYSIKKGCNLLSISAAFTVPTGKAHWHTLLRARAIENQCYVVAAAQWGKHNEKIQTFGHSLIIDPWGEVIEDAKEGEKIIYATLDKNHLKEVRSRMQVLL